LQSTAAATAAAGVMAGGVHVASAEPKKAKKELRFAMVGCGGRAGAHYGWAGDARKGCRIVAICDADKNRMAGKGRGLKNAKQFSDYRDLFKEMGDKIDAVVVATPDHNHYPAAMRALKLGKAVYCEKPLVWSVWEGQQLAKEVAKQKVASQMGNQGMGGDGWRKCHSFITGGAIGDVKEVHTWTNRPIWPQGIGRPEGQDDPAKDNMDWNAWIGPAPMRPYKGGRVYHPFVWRGWLDFGAGALGDMACHTMNALFKILEPGYPTEVETLAATNVNNETYPSSETIKWVFPKTDKRPGFTAFWYDGPNSDKAVPVPSAFEKGRKLPRTGSMFVGTKSVLLVTGDYNNSPQLVPESYRREYGNPKRTVERSIGHMNEFIAAAKGEKPWDYPQSNFTYAGHMTAVICLGIISQRVGVGNKLKFCPESLKFTGSNCEAANKLMRRIERKGWEA